MNKPTRSNALSDKAISRAVLAAVLHTHKHLSPDWHAICLAVIHGIATDPNYVRGLARDYWADRLPPDVFDHDWIEPTLFGTLVHNLRMYSRHAHNDEVPLQ